MQIFFKKYWEKALAVIAILIVIFSLQIATNANSNAHQAIVQAKSAAVDAKNAADEIAKAEVRRAEGSCDSSTQLRDLLDELDALLISPLSKNPEIIKAHNSIKAFTGDNPNCRNVPKAPNE